MKSKRPGVAGIGLGNGLRGLRVNQQQADKIGHLKRENKTLKANRDKLQETCIEHQHELNKLRSQVRRIRDITKE